VRYNLASQVKTLDGFVYSVSLSLTTEVILGVMLGGLVITDCDSGPYLRLVAASVKLARRDLDDPEFSAGAQAYLSGESFEPAYARPKRGKVVKKQPVGINLRLFAELLGYGGRWDKR